MIILHPHIKIEYAFIKKVVKTFQFMVLDEISRFKVFHYKKWEIKKYGLFSVVQFFWRKYMYSCIYN